MKDMNEVDRSNDAHTGSVIGVYTNLNDAEAGVRALDKGGFPIRQVSIIGRDFANEKEVRGFVTTGDVARGGAGAGAWFGGILGLFAGAALLWVPGAGPLVVAGPLAAALVGGAEGAAVGAGTGGLLGALAGWGVNRRHVIKYEDHLKAGEFVLVTHGTDAELARAQAILAGTHGVQVDRHDRTAVAA